MKRVGVTFCKTCYRTIDVRVNPAGRRYLSEHDNSRVHFCEKFDDDVFIDRDIGEAAIHDMKEILT